MARPSPAGFLPARRLRVSGDAGKIEILDSRPRRSVTTRFRYFHFYFYLAAGGDSREAAY
jgi:hypothetical protein